MFTIISIAFIVSSNWAINSFGNVHFNEIFFHILVPMEGTSTDIINQYIIECVPKTIIISVLLILISYFIIKEYKMFKAKYIRLVIIIVLFISSSIYSLNKIKFNEFISD